MPNGVARDPPFGERQLYFLCLNLKQPEFAQSTNSFSCAFLLHANYPATPQATIEIGKYIQIPLPRR